MSDLKASENASMISINCISEGTANAHAHTCTAARCVYTPDYLFRIDAFPQSGQIGTVETVYKHHPRWKANAMLIASYVYVQILFYYIIDKLFSKGVGGSSFGGFKKFL